MATIAIKPKMLRWARERADLNIDQLAVRFPKLGQWESGETQPTLKQLENYAKATHTPIGYLFLPEPMEDRIPIPDFRTMDQRELTRPSLNLLETVFLCQQRQTWYHDFAKSHEAPRSFVGSVSRTNSIEKTAQKIREALGFDLAERAACPTWTEALRRFMTQADALGILVMCSGVVLNNNTRKLDPREFRGFAMVDDYAPLIFINGADTKAAQMFTLAHELVHIWLGQSAVSNAGASDVSGNEVERWCNQVAAELLVPMRVFHAEIEKTKGTKTDPSALARRFKVSTLVILRRLLDAGKLTRKAFSLAYEDELRRLTDVPKGSGGDFYLTQATRVSKRFARALVSSTLEGQTLFRDAFHMLGISKVATFQELGRSLELR